MIKHMHVSARGVGTESVWGTSHSPTS